MSSMNPYWYHKTVSRLREFFISQGFIEAPGFMGQSVLVVSDDPETVCRVGMRNDVWPMPQNRLFNLVRSLNETPDLPGLFSISTSYRDEYNPQPGRHEAAFPIFEFVCKGNYGQIRSLSLDLIKYLGFSETFEEGDYLEIAKKIGVHEIDANAERMIEKGISEFFCLENFPQEIGGLWPIKQCNGFLRKCDVLMYGMETMDFAELENDSKTLQSQFYQSLNGGYSKYLIDNFGEKRVKEELSALLEASWQSMSYGSLGVPRMVNALKLLDLNTPKDEMSAIESLLGFEDGETVQI